ncbi:S9 family peptidase [Lysobacter silvisoli]|uniref:S9 family peptidase n=1 Tax=Lysobacter silvisoli TaxID=2293254 RepID=A0A371K1R3_9GAMM|nr:prolyl oligopeptidase family serine peptidase [Lysobacter silvisoli]RDZ27871.1 S9 family peptidase [Lysobacter silvisoli]
MARVRAGRLETPMNLFPIAPWARALARCAAVLALLGASAAALADDASDLRTAVAAERVRPQAPAYSRAQFLAKPALLGAWLSPDGRQVAYLLEGERNRGVWLLPTAGGAPRRLLAHTDANALSWSRDGRWLFLQTSKQLYALATAGQAGSGAIAELGGRRPRNFESVDPALPAAVVVSESPPPVSRLPKRWRLYRVDVHGKQSLLHEDTRPIADFAFDARGRLAYVIRAEADHYAIYRKHGARLGLAMRCVQLQRCSVLAMEGERLWLLSDAGHGHQRLASLEADGRLRTAHADPRGEADLDQVVLDPISQQPLIAAYRSTRAANYGLTPEAARRVQAIERRLPDRNLRIQAGSGAGARWLVQERAGSQKGERYYLYEPNGDGLREIFADAGLRQGRAPVARIPESSLARKIAFAYRASDGMRLHGFVSVPPGVDPAHAPLVANVHGGPFNLSRPEFSAQSQLLANRGYVVFEPNFRGSTGHGRAYMTAGRGDFGNGRVQQDIVEGVRYLLAQGIGDGARVGIVGASFGGYSALQGVTFQPELFKVAVAAVPPADFGWVLRAYARGQDQFSRGIPLATTMRLLALDPADPAVAERLRAQSPVANAARLRRPVLLLAGGDDERVPIRSVLHYAATLRALDKDVSLFVDAEGGHHLVDPLTREAYLYLLEDLLHRRLGGAAPSAPTRPLRAHLRNNLRLAGSDLATLARPRPPSTDATAMR